MKGTLWRSLALLLLLVGGGLVVCRPVHAEAGPRPAGLVKLFGGNPLTLELRLDRERLTVAERLTVELVADTPEGYAVKFVKPKEFNDFMKTAVTQPKPELTTTGRVAVSMRYTLEPLAAGPATIPPLTVEAWRKDEVDAAVTAVESEPLLVQVESLLTKKDKDETSSDTATNEDNEESISDIALPVEKPVNPWLLAEVGGALLALTLLVVYVWRRRARRVIPPPPPLPPHLLAYQALDRLLAQDLLTRGEIKAFYEVLSDILRHYIEQRFGLHAAEQTTEEFLVELGRVRTGPMAASHHRLLLRDFLSHCDLVKFAKHTPARPEAEDSVELCRRFVRETEPAAEPGGAA